MYLFISKEILMLMLHSLLYNLISACNCNREGSATLQCDRETGKCQCLEGIGGLKCDECARGFTGRAPYCQPCGECFDNWDIVLTELKGRNLFLSILCVCVYVYILLYKTAEYSVRNKVIN